MKLAVGPGFQQVEMPRKGVLGRRRGDSRGGKT